jgi:hypothetical protein
MLRHSNLTLIDVFAHAKPLIMLIFAGLIVAAAYAAFVYIRGVLAHRNEPARGLGFLAALASGGPLLGLLGAAYGLLDMCIGIANVQPAPSVTTLAPGYAEAALSVTLGLLAGAIGVIGHRHLKVRLEAIHRSDPSVAAPSARPSDLARVIA